MKIFFVLIILAQIIFLTSCQTINKKAQDALNKETKELSGYLNQPVSELKIFMGKPDKVIINDQGSELLIYISKKYKIKCERKFEIKNKMVVGFSSKNCF